jgi:hypothetical protein
MESGAPATFAAVAVNLRTGPDVASGGVCANSQTAAKEIPQSLIAHEMIL